MLADLCPATEASESSPSSRRRTIVKDDDNDEVDTALSSTDSTSIRRRDGEVIAGGYPTLLGRWRASTDEWLSQTARDHPGIRQNDFPDSRRDIQEENGTPQQSRRSASKTDTALETQSACLPACAHPNQNDAMPAMENIESGQLNRELTQPTVELQSLRRELNVSQTADLIKDTKADLSASSILNASVTDSLRMDTSTVDSDLMTSKPAHTSRSPLLHRTLSDRSTDVSTSDVLDDSWTSISMPLQARDLSGSTVDTVGGFDCTDLSPLGCSLVRAKRTSHLGELVDLAQVNAGFSTAKRERFPGESATIWGGGHDKSASSCAAQRSPVVGSSNPHSANGFVENDADEAEDLFAVEQADGALRKEWGNVGVDPVAFTYSDALLKSSSFRSARTSTSDESCDLGDTDSCPSRRNSSQSCADINNTLTCKSHRKPPAKLDALEQMLKFCMMTAEAKTFLVLEKLIFVVWRAHTQHKKKTHLLKMRSSKQSRVAAFTARLHIIQLHATFQAWRQRIFPKRVIPVTRSSPVLGGLV